MTATDLRRPAWSLTATSGDTLAITARFRDVDGELLDPQPTATIWVGGPADATVDTTGATPYTGTVGAEAVTFTVSVPSGRDHHRWRLIGGGWLTIGNLHVEPSGQRSPSEHVVDFHAGDLSLELHGGGTTEGGGDGPPPSSVDPEPLGVVDPGTSGAFSRGDHVHPMPSATDVGADPAGTAAGLVGAITPGDIGAEVAGAASVVAGDLTDHENENTAAHGGIVADTDPRLTDARTPTAHSHAQSDVTGLDTALGAKADTASLGNSAGLDVGTTAGTVAAGNDARFTDARQPLAHTHPIADLTDLPAIPSTAADVGAIAIAAGVTVIDAGDDLATARPSGIGVAYWLFDDDTVDVGTGGADIVNGQPGDLWFVPDA